jgi:hypothetical protein
MLYNDLLDGQQFACPLHAAERDRAVVNKPLTALGGREKVGDLVGRRDVAHANLAGLLGVDDEADVHAWLSSQTIAGGSE